VRCSLTGTSWRTGAVSTQGVTWATLGTRTDGDREDDG
jgi:hypothetical protein